MSKRRGMVSTEANQTIWPHVIVGFVLAAGAVRWLGAELGVSGAAGLVGAGLGYLRHCWVNPLVRCWWPTWFWLAWFGLQGCGANRSAMTSGKYFGVQKRCPLHPNSPVYVRPVARMLPTKRKPPKDKP